MRNIKLVTKGKAKKSVVRPVPKKQVSSDTKLDGIRLKLFLDRYALKDKNGNPVEKRPEEMWLRVARAVAGVEKSTKLKKHWEKVFYDAMVDFKFCPAGRFLTSAGTGSEATTINCYVIPSPEDTRHGIIKTLENVTEISARGGGVGFNISTLRPRNSYLKSVNGTSSGAVSWSELYSIAAHDIIQQGGTRRGALMMMMWDWHPDIEEFITVKKQKGKMLGANLSVCISDAFMDAVKKDADWRLTFPDTDFEKYRKEWRGDMEEWQKKGYPIKLHKTVKARYLWDLICESAWASAEPGIVFMDRYNQMNNSWYFEKNIATNPCVTGDTLVSTSRGLMPIRELGGKKNIDVLIDARLSSNKFLRASKVLQTGIKDVFSLITKEGYKMKLTSEHRVMTTRGWVAAEDMKPGEKIYIASRAGGFGIEGNLEEGQILGWLVGDGTMKAAVAVLSFFGKEKEELAPRFSQIVSQLVNQVPAGGRSYPVGYIGVKNRDELRVESKRLWRYAFDNGISRKDKLKVPKRVFAGSRDMQEGFLSALFTADGHVAGSAEKGVSVRLTSVSKRLLRGVQLLLLNFGIASKIYSFRRKVGYRALPDGKGGKKEYLCRAYHDLVISKDNVGRFAKEIGFMVDYKNAKLVDAIRSYLQGFYKEKFLVTLKKLVFKGKELVYDLVQPETHSFIANGFVVHNCGEQGLPAWGVCNLSSVNLAAFVKDGKFDFGQFEKVVAVGTRFLDNGVDAEKYLNRDVELQQKGERRLGLGTIGLADALIKMKVRYGSKASFNFIDDVFARLRDVSYRTSVDLAREKGVFKKFDARKFLRGKFVQTLPEDIRSGIKKHGIRNCFLVTEAPTGKISLLAGVSSGIEPVFSYSYKQKDRLGERVMYHPLYQEWITKNKDKEVPDYFVTADDLTPDEHIQVQAIIQKYTDSSISKTVNAPKTHTIADVKKLYTLAYETGCKGVSYMREGSREGTLERANGNEVKEESKAPLDTRPFVVPGSTYRLETPVGIAFITINETQGGDPMELFINVGKAGSDVQAMAQALGRTISAALRFRSNVGPKERAREIAMQLAGIGGRRSVGFGPTKVLSLPDAVACAISMHFDFRINGFLKREPVASQNAQEKSNGVLPNGNGHVSIGAMAGVLGQVMETDQKKFSLGDAHNHVGDICPSCGSSSLVFQESCSKCFVCGHSEC